MSDEERIAEIRRKAVQCVLSTLSGAIYEGSELELAAVCTQFALAHKANIERIVREGLAEP